MSGAAGWYERRIFNPLMDRTLRAPSVAALRDELLAGVGDEVVEVGLGTGLNLLHYPRGARVRAVVREPELDARALVRARERGLELEHLRGDAVELPLEACSVRRLVCTFVLCSVEDPARALREFARVLAPGGELLLIEHVRSPRPLERLVQRALTPLHRNWACGCRMDRDLLGDARSAGFDTAALEVSRHGALPFPASELLRGAARR